MSRRTLTLPLRLASTAKTQPSQWICRRCLATQAEATAVPPVPDHLFQQTVPQPSTPSQSHQAQQQPSSGYDASLPAAQRDYRLRKTDFHLKKPLPQKIPIQYLQHSTTDLLHHTEKAQREKTVAHREIVGVVVSAGKMEKTVKVRIPGQRWEKRIGKYFASHTNHLVHDPNTSLVPGDVVSLHRLRVSKAVHHVVASIIAPFGTPIESRPPIPSPDDRLAEYKAHRFAKLKRRSLRREAAKGNADAIRELRAMGLDPGHGVEGGKGEKANLQPNTGKTRDSGKGPLLGEKGQKLPKGVLPGGKHEVGKIDERAKRNKGVAMRLERRAEENLLAAEQVEERVGRERGVSAEEGSAVSVTRGRLD